MHLRNTTVADFKLVLPASINFHMNPLERPHTTRFPSCDRSDRMRYVTTGRRRGSWQMTEIPSQGQKKSLVLEPGTS